MKGLRDLDGRNRTIRTTIFTFLPVQPERLWLDIGLLAASLAIDRDILKMVQHTLEAD